ncbi:MAG: ABC transporter ATP-binding protein [Deltaproteobacteria bacterium]|nr:ABC transporter ATP-binding protein [Deltaproteobacteria bacterium]
MFTLKVSDIGKNYGETLLFKNISFEVKQGDVLAITGWNGSGKSTLLRIIAGLVKPSCGQVEMFLNGEPVSRESRRRFLGMVAPALSLYDELTGLENMEFFSKVRGLSCDRKDCLDIIDSVGLTGHATKASGEYSSGMKQRLKLAQALLHKPPLLLLDEPGTNLDSKGIGIVEELVLKQRQSGVTVIASNEKREADYADRIINLSECGDRYLAS